MLSNCCGPFPFRRRKDPWPKVLEKASKSVVMLKVSSVRFFEHQESSLFIASGFVVDKKLGLILSNRHVVQAGPVRGSAFFFNSEDVAVHSIYRDPEHDFGFFKYDPKSVLHMDVDELELFPEAAKIGVGHSFIFILKR